MTTRRRTVEEIEFDPASTARVLEVMARLGEAGDGWVNLLPGVPEEEVEESPRSVFSALFGNAQPPVSMCTWMPPKPGGSARGDQTLGIMHPRGRHAVSQLASMGVLVPAGWRVRQDHARRGVILHPPAAASYEVVLDWALRAGASLAIIPLTGRWKAQVFLPR